VTEDILDSWVGKSVHIEVLSGIGNHIVGPAVQRGYEVGVAGARGVLTEVSERGIFLTNDRAGDLFFSWNAVLMIQPSQEVRDWRR
jgi:hypothetical protein